jgi:hypothetical protein
MTMYDRADWHYGADSFPTNMPRENGGTHIGFFLAWVINSHLEGELFQQEFPAELAAVRARKMTGRDFFFQHCDEKLTDDTLNDEGNAFADAYYNTYLEDYDKAFTRRFRGIYRVDDTWENYELMATTIAAAFEDWKRPKPRPWWRFWGE